jgi:hypothetical protein
MRLVPTCRTPAPAADVSSSTALRCRPVDRDEPESIQRRRPPAWPRMPLARVVGAAVEEGGWELANQTSAGRDTRWRGRPTPLCHAVRALGGSRAGGPAQMGRMSRLP